MEGYCLLLMNGSGLTIEELSDGFVNKGGV